MTIDSSIHGQRWPQLHIETVYNQPSTKYNHLSVWSKSKILFRLKFFNQATCMLILYFLCLLIHELQLGQGDKRNRESTDIVAVASM